MNVTEISFPMRIHPTEMSVFGYFLKFNLNNEIKKRCFLGRVEHGLALCHYYKYK